MSDPCHDFHELMTDALDGRLEAADRDRFERLLAESPDRRREWDAYREMRELLLQVGTERAPGELAGTVAGAVRADDGPGGAGIDSVSAWSHLRKMGWARAAAVAAVFIAVVVTLRSYRALDAAAPVSRQVADGAAPRDTGRGAAFPETLEIGDPSAARDVGEAEIATDEDVLLQDLKALQSRVATLQAEEETRGVVEQALMLFHRNRDRLSLGEMQSRGVVEFGAVADRRVQELQNLGVEVTADWVGRQAGPPTEEAVGGVADKRGAPGAPKAAGKRLVAPGNRGAGGASATRGGRAAATPPAAKGPDTPPAAGAPAGNASQARTSPVPSESRVFFALIGSDALGRTRTVLEGVSGVRELPGDVAFKASEKRSQPIVKAGEAQESAGDKTKERSPAVNRAVPAKSGYRIFQVTLPTREADLLVGRLETQPGLVLRILGESLLSGAPGRGAPSRPRPGSVVRKQRDGGTLPMRTLVLVVLER